MNAAPLPDGEAVRGRWWRLAERLAAPVLGHLAAGTLHAAMPVECRPGQREERARFTRLEAVGRLLCGLAPWLAGDGGDAGEQAARSRLRGLALAGLARAADPGDPDHLDAGCGHQPIVDAAFLAHALLRAPALVAALAPRDRERVAALLAATRSRKPGANNWLLFAAAVETGLAALGRQPDLMRIDYALRQFEQWYRGDGIYGDGAQVACDYYNSLVIHPLLVALAAHACPLQEDWKPLAAPIRRRARRHAAVLEQLVAPDGSYPVVGRSSAYRCGSFHHLADAALRADLADGLDPAQVRTALDAVVRRQMDAPGTWDAGGWLTIGVCGHQPGMGEGYISTGSCYLAATVLLPLGLDPAAPFWSRPARPWTQLRIWSGDPDATADHADH